MFTKRSIFSASLAALALLAPAYVRAADTLPAPAVSAKAVNPIKTGETVPDVTLTTMDGKPMPLRDTVAAKPTVLVFYRGGWCPYCNVQMAELGKREAELAAMGYQVIAVSPDLPVELRKSVGKNDLKYQLASDSKAEAIRALGIGFVVDPATIEKYKGYGIDLEKSSGEMHHILPVPTVLILDRTGTVKFVYANPDYKVRLDGAVLVAAAKSALGEAKPKATK